MRESGDSSFKYLQNIYTVKNVGEQGLSLALALCGRLGAAVFGESACLFLSFRPYGAVRVEQTRILEGETAFDV